MRTSPSRGMAIPSRRGGTGAVPGVPMSSLREDPPPHVRGPSIDALGSAQFGVSLLAPPSQTPPGGQRVPRAPHAPAPAARRSRSSPTG